MIDYHVHPDFSPDARGSIAAYCIRAIEVGLTEICFTTHYEPDPARLDREWVIVSGVQRSPDSDWPMEYFRQIEEARAKFSGLSILAGVEVGYEMGLEGVISDFLKRHPFDYALGAIHCLDHISITSGDELDEFKGGLGRMPAGSVVRRYFQYVQAVAGSKLFDCIAHLDIYRKYVRPLFGPGFDAEVSKHIGPALETIVRSGTGLEVNSSALRRGEAEPYPALGIIRQAKDAGVRLFTIGSDAHRPEDLGRGLAEVHAALSGPGIAPVRFRKRSPF